MDNKEILARSRDAIRALEAGVELSVEERWACYEALQFYLELDKEDDDEPWGPLEATYRLPSGDEIEVRTGNKSGVEGVWCDMIIIPDPFSLVTLANDPTKGQVRKLVALLGAQEI